MILLVDTREQKPLPFHVAGMITEIRREKLDIGDYACQFVDGHRPPVVFERKGLSDLFGTMTKGYPRFKREMARANLLGWQLVLAIEGSLTEVYAGVGQSSYAGSSCVKKLFTLAVRYDVYPVFCRTRQEMTDFIQETFEAIGRTYVSQQRKSR